MENTGSGRGAGLGGMAEGRVRQRSRGRAQRAVAERGRLPPAGGKVPRPTSCKDQTPVSIFSFIITESARACSYYSISRYAKLNRGGEGGREGDRDSPQQQGARA